MFCPAAKGTEVIIMLFFPDLTVHLFSSGPVGTRAVSTTVESGRYHRMVRLQGFLSSCTAEEGGIPCSRTLPALSTWIGDQKQQKLGQLRMKVPAVSKREVRLARGSWTYRSPPATAMN